MSESSYRPHNPGHDYYDRGVYLVTLVVSGRVHRLSSLNMDMRAPDVVMTDIGRYIYAQWQKSEQLQLKYGNHIKVLNQVVMPDHWHGVILVEKRMSWCLGDIINAVKSACTSQWRHLTGYQQSPLTARMIRHMSHEGRREYYSRLPYEQRPLFDDDYDDTICLTDAETGGYDRRHLQAMLHYVDDNPRRAIIRKLRPGFMQRCLHVEMEVMTKDGRRVVREYAAFGNLFLLRWVRKVQVYCHRKAADGHTPYESTDEYRQRCMEWKREVMEGQTVIVTPGISSGELFIKNRCLESGYPLIHLQKEAIGRWWKPEKSRFEACSNGSLLILAPWEPDNLGDVNGVPSGTDYSMFHNLNMLAEEICSFDGKAHIRMN